MHSVVNEASNISNQHLFINNKHYYSVIFFAIFVPHYQLYNGTCKKVIKS